MQELFARLRRALADNPPDSPNVQDLLQEIDRRFPEDAWRARAMVDGIIISEGGEPQLSDPADDKSSWLSWKTVMPLLAGLGMGGGSVAGFTKLSPEDLKKLPLPDVTSQWVLLIIVAAVGAVVGLAYSFYRNNWSLIFPVFSRDGRRLRILSLGFLGNMLVASVASITTTWTAFSNVAVENPDAPASTRAPTAEAPHTLLTWNILVSAVVAGIIGSRMASGHVEMKNLWKALSSVAEAPPVAGLGTRIEEAKTPFEAITIATGTPPPGFVPTEGTVNKTAAIEKELLSMFDRVRLKDAVAKLGKPLGPDGAGLTLALLQLFQPLKSGIKILLGGFEIANVAKMSAEDFTQEAENRGIEASNFKELLAHLHEQSVRVMELLSSLPQTWTLSADRI